MPLRVSYFIKLKLYRSLAALFVKMPSSKDGENLLKMTIYTFAGSSIMASHSKVSPIVEDTKGRSGHDSPYRTQKLMDCTSKGGESLC